MLVARKINWYLLFPKPEVLLHHVRCISYGVIADLVNYNWTVPARMQTATPPMGWMLWSCTLQSILMLKLSKSTRKLLENGIRLLSKCCRLWKWYVSIYILKQLRNSDILIVVLIKSLPRSPYRRIKGDLWWDRLCHQWTRPFDTC